MCLNILIQIASHRDTVRVADDFPELKKVVSPSLQPYAAWVGVTDMSCAGQGMHSLFISSDVCNDACANQYNFVIYSF